MKLRIFEAMGSRSFYEYAPTSPAERIARHPWSLACYGINFSTIRN